MHIISYAIRKKFHPKNVSGPDERWQKIMEECRIDWYVKGK